MPTAILIDGAYFIKRFRAIDPEHGHDAGRVADAVHQWACAHLVAPRRNGASAVRARDLYRIFFYDCPPLQKKMHHPLTGRVVDFATSAEAVFRLALHANLRTKRNWHCGSVTSLRMSTGQSGKTGSPRCSKASSLLRA